VKALSYQNSFQNQVDLVLSWKDLHQMQMVDLNY